MRVGYSILREIRNKNYNLTGTIYGLKDYEFESFVFFLESQGYLDRVLRVNEHFSLKPARLTKKGEELLVELRQYEETYPIDIKDVIEWVSCEKEMYSNGAIQE